MRGDLLDVILAVLAIGFAFTGYRQGFLVGALSFTGFGLGAVFGTQIAPEVAQVFDTRDPTIIGVGVVLVLALLGQVVGGVLGGRLRQRLRLHPARLLDAAGGAVVSVVALLLVTWLIGTAIATSRYQQLSDQVRRSAIIAAVDEAIPDAVRDPLRDFRDLLDDRGFPEVFGRLTPSDPRQAALPDSALTRSRVVQAVEPKVLKVQGIAPSCSQSVEGTGFVYAADRIMTNAHVVAGVEEVTVEVGDETLDATVVVYDPLRDLAVLKIDDLGIAPLAFTTEQAEPGDSAIVVGYPRDGPYRADAARIREVLRARGPGIYGKRTVVREIYSTRGRVQPGNSGGPLITPSGKVLGVVFAAAVDRSDVGYVLTADEVAPVAARGRTASAEVDTLGCD